MESFNHIVLGCSHPKCQGTFINKHNTALNLFCEALSKGEMTHSLLPWKLAVEKSSSNRELKYLDPPSLP
eukprot:155612-Pelagomonas_calceolata.AAC.1